jgi:hypothetical protein
MITVKTPFKGPPPKNARLSPGVYADGRGGTIRSKQAPGPVDPTAAVFNAVANGGLAGGVTLPQQQIPGQAMDTPPEQQPSMYAPGGFDSRPPAPTPFPQNPASLDPGYAQSPLTPPKAEQNVVPNSNVQYGDVARGGVPANQPPPPRGTRLSPGVYADGQGGSYRSLSGR